VVPNGLQNIFSKVKDLFYTTSLPQLNGVSREEIFLLSETSRSLLGFI